MVPFYGQGLNCGLEDVRVLDLLLRDEGVNPNMQLAGDHEDYRLASALARYSETRHEDLVAICDLAMNNQCVPVLSSHERRIKHLMFASQP